MIYTKFDLPKNLEITLWGGGGGQYLDGGEKVNLLEWLVFSDLLAICSVLKCAANSV